MRTDEKYSLVGLFSLAFWVVLTLLAAYGHVEVRSAFAILWLCSLFMALYCWVVATYYMLKEKREKKVEAYA